MDAGYRHETNHKENTMKLLHSDELQIGIAGMLYEVDNVSLSSYLPMIDTDDGCEYYIAISREVAGQAAREYWEDLAQTNPSEFACLVGKDTLVSWALGQWAGPGSTQVQSLDEWLDLHLDCPEENFASYDMYENDITAISTGLLEELGWDSIIIAEDELERLKLNLVAYRHN